MTKTEIQNRIKSIEIAAYGMGIRPNAGQAAIIAKLRKQLDEAEEG